MSSLDIESLYTNIPLEKTIEKIMMKFINLRLCYLMIHDPTMPNSCIN